MIRVVLKYIYVYYIIHLDMYRYVYIYLDSIVNYTKNGSFLFMTALKFPFSKMITLPISWHILDKLLYTHICMFIYNMHICMFVCGCTFMCIISGKAQTNIFPFLCADFQFLSV